MWRKADLSHGIYTDLDGKTRKLQGVTSTGELWVSKAFDIISDLEKDSKHYSSIVEMEEEALKARVDAPKTLGTIRKLVSLSSFIGVLHLPDAPQLMLSQLSCNQPLAVSDASLRDRTRAFELLLLSTLLVSYDDAEEASDLLEVRAEKHRYQAFFELVRLTNYFSSRWTSARSVCSPRKHKPRSSQKMESESPAEWRSWSTVSSAS